MPTPHFALLRAPLLALPFAGILLALGPRPLTAQDSVSGKRRATIVRYSEGTAHGFLLLRDSTRARIAFGDLVQIPTGGGVKSQMILRFRDKSLFDEMATFTQHGVFALISYHLIQKGPAFARDLDARITSDGQYQVTSISHGDSQVTRLTGHLDLPADVSNGLVVTLAKNLRAGDTATVHLVAFTPKPQLVELLIAYTGQDSVTIGDERQPVARYLVKPQLAGVKGLVAKLLGKLPHDSHMWILTGKAPAFVRFEGPLYDGPVWSLSQVSPVWP